MKKETPLSPDYKQDFNTLVWPVFMATKRKIRSVALAGGKYKIEALSPKEGGLQIARGVEFTEEDAWIPRTLDAKVLRYLLFLSQNQKEKGAPAKTVKSSAGKMLRAILPAGAKYGQKQVSEVLKSLYRWRFVNYHVEEFYTSEEEIKQGISHSLNFGVLQLVEVKDEPGYPYTVTFTDLFYDLVVNSKFLRQLNFEVFRALKSGITQRLYEFCVALGPGKHYFPLWEFYERIGVFGAQRSPADAWNAKQWVLSSLKKLEKEPIGVEVTIYFPTSAKGMVIILIKKKEKKKEDLSMTEMKKLFRILKARKGVREPMGVLKTMNEKEIELELEIAKEETLNELASLLEKIQSLRKALVSYGITVVDETPILITKELLQKMSRAELFEKEETLKEVLKKKERNFENVVETLHWEFTTLKNIKKLLEKSETEEKVPSWEDLVPSQTVREKELTEQVEELTKRIRKELEPLLKKVQKRS